MLELLRIKSTALQEPCGLPNSMGQSRETRGLPAALNAWFSQRGYCLCTDYSRMTLCGVVKHHSLALRIVPGVISQQNYRAEIKLGSPRIQPCSFPQLLLKGFSKIAVIS